MIRFLLLAAFQTLTAEHMIDYQFIGIYEMGRISFFGIKNSLSWCPNILN